MMKQNNDEAHKKVLEYMKSSKTIKIVSIFALSVLSFYLLGHVFKITAHTVRGFKDLKSAIQNG